MTTATRANPPTGAESEQRADRHRRWHALHAAEAAAALETDTISGLPADEVRRRLDRFGENMLREPRRRSLVSVFVHQFKSPLIYLLFMAAGIALALGHTRDAIVIFVVLLLNATIGTLQEGRAERALEALRRLAIFKVRVVRGGRESIVDAREVVPGDIVLIEAGDAIVADARLLEGAALQVAEAALTGESVPIGKDLRPLSPDTPLADRRNMVYAGTHVTAGRARVVVVATGSATEIGHIAALAEAAEQPKTPLELRIAKFGRHVVVAAAGLFILVMSVGSIRGFSLDQILMVGVSQVVSMIPEGLPVAMTVALAVGVQRMARRRAVVRKLSAIETLGSTTVICSDKTGTLTRNEMTVTALYVPPGRVLSVAGAGWEPVGVFAEDAREVDPLGDPELRTLLEAVTLCNDAQLRGPEDEEPRWRPIGDPTEVALVSVAIKGGLVPGELRSRYPRRTEIPFDPASKMMATQHDLPAGTRVVLKGAPEAVLELCGAARTTGRDEPLGGDGREAIRAAADRMAADALRVLAVAVVEGAEIDGRAGCASGSTC